MKDPAERRKIQVFKIVSFGAVLAPAIIEAAQYLELGELGVGALQAFILGLSEILKETQILVEPKRKISSTEVLIDIEADPKISCDAVEIEQVFVNLINNSLDACASQPSPWVRIQVLERDNLVVARVTDCGHGISPDVERNLFQPFFTTKVVGEGTGLGLSIVKGIIENHNGTISLLRSEPNTCFEITIPKWSGSK